VDKETMLAALNDIERNMARQQDLAEKLMTIVGVCIRVTTEEQIAMVRQMLGSKELAVDDVIDKILGQAEGA
jgi:hypothetical protein